eukprot:m51a1_g5033 putative guanyl-nucleotide exchange factor vps901 (568) ;mRNA; f:370037-371740
MAACLLSSLPSLPTLPTPLAAPAPPLSRASSSPSSLALSSCVLCPALPREVARALPWLPSCPSSTSAASSLSLPLPLPLCLRVLPCAPLWLVVAPAGPGALAVLLVATDGAADLTAALTPPRGLPPEAAAPLVAAAAAALAAACPWHWGACCPPAALARRLRLGRLLPGARCVRLRPVAAAPPPVALGGLCAPRCADRLPLRLAAALPWAPAWVLGPQGPAAQGPWFLRCAPRSALALFLVSLDDDDDGDGDGDGGWDDYDCCEGGDSGSGSDSIADVAGAALEAAAQRWCDAPCAVDALAEGVSAELRGQGVAARSMWFAYDYDDGGDSGGDSEGGSRDDVVVMFATRQGRGVLLEGARCRAVERTDLGGLGAGEAAAAVCGYVYGQLYPFAFGAARSAARDAALAARLQRLRPVLALAPAYLGLDPAWCASAAFAGAVAQLRRMDDSARPADKLRALGAACAALRGLAGPPGAAADSADTFLPAVVALVLQARMPTLLANARYAERYGAPLARAGELAYYLTTLRAAVLFLGRLDLAGAAPLLRQAAAPEALPELQRRIDCALAP